jgi:CheY-like chemotaxis protein/REP element-mobilizing transposase RayT
MDSAGAPVHAGRDVDGWSRDASKCARVGRVALPVLVVDPDPELAALVQQSLEKEYACRVGLAANSSEALAAARASEFRLAIVDLDLPDLRESDLIRRLRSLQPGMLLLALSANPVAFSAEPLGIHASLPKPFYLPDLMAKIHQLISTMQLSPDEAAAARIQAPAHRLGSAAEAARLVARGARDSGAYLVLLTRDGRRWVHAGPMPQPHVEQVVARIQEYGIRPDTPGAVARYLRFAGAVDAFLLYCLSLADDYLLAILYPARVPFGSVRRQAERLAEMLSQPSAPGGSPARASVRPMATDEVIRLPHDWMPQPSARFSLPFLDPRPEVPPAPAKAAPDPRQAALPGDWLPGGSPLPVVHSILDAPVREIPLTRARDIPSAPPPGLPSTRRTGPLPATAAVPTRISLVYVPRDPELALQSSLASTLVNWTKEVCRALDFHPVDIQVRPDALCMTIELPPGASPPTAAHRMRQELSHRIAATYPSQAAAAASGRFWASRYLLMPGEPPSSQRITEFVRETRGPGLPRSAAQ